jgi:2-polyprenyl-3-methyl-5-hydroxy-6-metoxy-1,4-benzoquinol methylase
MNDRFKQMEKTVATPFNPNSGQANQATLTENEIRPDALMAEQARLFAEDVSRLMAHRAEFVQAPCPACEAAAFEPAFEKAGMPFVRCRSCDTIFANPRPTAAHMEDYYRHSKNYQYWSEAIFPASENARREKIFKPRVQQVLQICQRFGVPTETLLEVGAGFGLFCEEMVKTQAFKRVIAVEPTPYLAEDCRRRGLDVIEKPIEQVERKQLLQHGGKIDVIANFEVIEHLFSPGQFIRQCAELLDEGGILILTCPNGKGFDIQVLREKSSAIDVEHVNLFNPKSLTLLLEQCGFDVIETQTPGRLDAELVRKALLNGDLPPESQPFLKQILIDEWDTQGAAFQAFLTTNRLSSNMLLTARKRG